jgi:hypothetical protein
MRSKKPDPEDRGDQRAGQAEHDQQRRDFAEQQVLYHVREQQFLTGLTERGEGGADRHEPRVEAGLAPAGHRVGATDRRSASEGAHAPRVEQASDQQRADG